MNKNENNLVRLLNSTFDKSTKNDICNNFLNELKDLEKWVCVSDYCFDDKMKANDVVTFSIFPYIVDHNVLENHIKVIAKKDIKNSKLVGESFLTFLKEFPVINFSFIFSNNDRKNLFGNDLIERRDWVLMNLNLIKEQYLSWISNEPDKELQYRKVLKNVDKCIVEAKDGKKINIYIDMILISFLGAYVSYLIITELDNIKIFGWFSDRDKIFEIGNGLVINLFQNNLHGHLNEKKLKYEFLSSLANSGFEIFYDQLIKIPDYIAGTLADYNQKENTISKDKFDTMLTGFMRENITNNFMFKLSRNGSQFSCSRVKIKNKST